MASLEFPAKDENLSIDYLSRQLSEPPMTQEERDEELDAELPQNVENNQEVFRPQFKNDGQRLVSALFLFSGVVKNMELIDAAEKRRHLADIWKGWSTLLHLSLTIVTKLSRDRRIRINGVLYEISAPHGMSNAELARNISLNMPASVSRLIAAMLGTEKLERQLVEPQLDAANQPLIYEFFRAALIADLRLSATAGALRTALDRLRSSSYLLEAMIWKIADLRRMDRLKPQQFEEIVASLAEAIANLKGGTNKVRMKEKQQQLQRLKKEGLMLRIRRQNERD
jgi:hypothetical protein